MMDKHKTPQSKNELAQHEVPQVLDFIKSYGKKIGTGALTVAILIVAVNAISLQRAKKIAEANAMYSAAQSPEQLQEVVDKYSATPVGPIALLDLAKTTFNNGNYFVARAKYEQFLKNYRNHKLAPTASYGLALCAEGEGDFNSAIEQYAAFAKAHGDHELTPLAIIGQARTMEQAGQIAEARIVLEDFLTSHASSQWSPMAENVLEQLPQ